MTLSVYFAVINVRLLNELKYICLMLRSLRLAAIFVWAATGTSYIIFILTSSM